MAPPAGFSGRRRQFDVACGVLSRCVKAQAAAPTMLLMPGADVTPDVREEETEAATTMAPLTIMYGDRVLVLDHFPSYRVAELLLLAERPDVAGGTTTADDDIPAVPRTVSLQRFMEKRRDRRLAARAPYGGGGGVRPGPASASASASSSNKERNQGELDVGSSWLGLGVPGRSAC